MEGEGEADEDKVKRLETVEGGEPDEVPMAVLRDPGNPTTKEREDHMASHLPYRSWCHICVEAKGMEDPHYRNRVKEICQVPVIGVDYKSFGESPTVEDKITVIIIRDNRSVSTFPTCSREERI